MIHYLRIAALHFFNTLFSTLKSHGVKQNIRISIKTIRQFKHNIELKVTQTLIGIS